MVSADLQEKIQSLAESFAKNGYGKLENFLSDDEVESIRDEIKRLIKEGSNTAESKQSQVFVNDVTLKCNRFLHSGDKVCNFYEKKAVNFDTEELNVPEELSLAKIGHALHSLNPVFKKLSLSQPIKDIYKAIGFVEPTIVQSMVIFKNPKIGSAYTPHQDAMFLYSDPPEHIAGVWIALDDATPENGCLDFIPGSHKWPLARRFVRTGKTGKDENLLEWTAPPVEYDDSQYVKVPAKKGDLVLIHGLVMHRSPENRSDKPRWVYAFHTYDKARSVWCEKNWLQMAENDTFLTLTAN